MARHPHRILLFVLAAIVFGLTSACERDLPPQLITLEEISPREAEVGDHFAISGAGFAEGKPARVIFRGTLKRPGEAPLEGAVIDATGNASSRETIDVLYTEELQTEFCRKGERAAHTTFHGDLEVAFAAVAAGAPPVTAVLHHVVLDFRPPSAPPSVMRDRLDEGGRVLSALGIHAKESSSETQRGIEVQSVDPGSSADEAGVLPDDLLTAFDGVRIVTQADAIPVYGAGTIELGLRRGKSAKEETKVLRAKDFARSAPSEVFGGALLLLVFAAGILLFWAPPPKIVLFCERLLAHEAPSQEEAKITPTVVVASLAVLGVVAGVDIDVAVAFLAVVTLLVLLAFVAPGSLFERFSGAMRALALELPVGLALAAAIGDAGSLRVRDIVAGQGGFPWEFVAFRSPAQVLVFAVFLLAAAAPRRVSPTVERLHGVALAGLGAALYLGGWTVPWLSPGAQRQSLVFGALGSMLFLVKVSLILMTVVRIKAIMRRVPLPELARFTLRWMIPLAVVALGVSLAWTTGLRWRLHPDWLRFVGLADAAVFVLALARVVHRVRGRLEEAHLNPFL